LQEGCGKLAPRGVFEFRNFTCKSRQNKEPTSGLEPLSCLLRVIIHVLQGFARGRKCRISKGVSFLCFALGCTVLRSRWCQSDVNVTSKPRFTELDQLTVGTLSLRCTK
jgi:hypothetical protein